MSLYYAMTRRLYDRISRHYEPILTAFRRQLMLTTGLLTGLVMCPGPALADGHTDALPEGYGLLLAMPGAGTELAEVALLNAPESLEGAERAPVSWVVADDARLTNTLRLDLHRHEVVPRLTPACTLEIPQLSVVVRELEDALKFLDFETAKSWSEKVDPAFSCEQEVIGPALLGRLALLQGVLERKLRRSDAGWFLTAAALHHDEKLLHRQSDTIRGHYLLSQESLASATHVPATVQLDQAGLEVFVDGKKATSPDVGLLPGAHFIQLVEPGGRVIRGAIEVVERPEAGAPRQPMVLPPRSMSVPGTDAVVLRLREAARAGRLDPALSAALVTLMAAGHHPWFLLLTGEQGTSPARGLWLLPSGATIPVKLSAGISKLGLVGTGTLAVATLVSGAGLLFFLAPVFTQTPVQDASPFIAGALGTGTSMVLGLGATSVLASRTFRIPRSIYRPSKLKILTQKMGLHVSAGAGTVAMEVRWK